ncbi:MAG: hypothetical protein A2Y76_07895 [Planctomycetes bacterium RBG_13_60_9]|nr:MAG: hypothetical protein A2Y76_07895 [Planctomycetes bacterium RBG_13_60_9]
MRRGDVDALHQVYHRYKDDLLTVAMSLLGDAIESLLARVGDRFLLPLKDVDSQAKTILSHANVRLAWGSYASVDLTAQADAICFVKHVNAK